MDRHGESLPPERSREADTKPHDPWWIPAAGAVGASLGAIGWITFLGGALLWISYGQAQLPAAEAVARVPTSVLVATGAQFVAVAAIAVLVAVSLLAFSDGALRRWARRRELEERRDRIRALTGASSVPDSAQTKALESLGALEELTEKAVDSSGELAELGASAGPRADALERVRHAEEELQQAATQLGDRMDDRRRQLEDHIKHSKLTGGEWIRALIIGMLVSGSALLFAQLASLGYGPIPAAGLLITILTSTCAGALGALTYLRFEYRRRRGIQRVGTSRVRFLAVALVMLIAVPLVGAVAVYFRASESPEVTPLAWLRLNGAPQVGFFVAEDSEHLTVGTFPQRVPTECVDPAVCPFDRDTLHVPPRMLSLPADQVSNVTIGPRLPLYPEDAETDLPDDRPQTARQWATSAALLLCRGLVPPVTASSKRTDNRANGCPRKFIARLEARALREKRDIREHSS